MIYNINLIFTPTNIVHNSGDDGYRIVKYVKDKYGNKWARDVYGGWKFYIFSSIGTQND